MLVMIKMEHNMILQDSHSSCQIAHDLEIVLRSIGETWCNQIHRMVLSNVHNPMIFTEMQLVAMVSN